MFLSDKSFSFMDACGGSINNSHRNSVYIILSPNKFVKYKAYKTLQILVPCIKRILYRERKSKSNYISNKVVLNICQFLLVYNIYHVNNHVYV